MSRYAHIFTFGDEQTRFFKPFERVRFGKGVKPESGLKLFIDVIVPGIPDTRWIIHLVLKCGSRELPIEFDDCLEGALIPEIYAIDLRFILTAHNVVKFLELALEAAINDRGKVTVERDGDELLFVLDFGRFTTTAKVRAHDLKYFIKTK